MLIFGLLLLKLDSLVYSVMWVPPKISKYFDIIWDESKTNTIFMYKYV